MTALHLAAQAGSEDCVSLLLLLLVEGWGGRFVFDRVWLRFSGEREGARGVLARDHLRHAARVGLGVLAQVGSMSSITSYYLS